MGLKKVYIARDVGEAQFLCDLLAEAGVRAIVIGDLLGTARGNVPLTPTTLPAVHVNEEDLALAAPVVEEFDRRQVERHHSPREQEKLPPWRCPKCRKLIEAQFTDCWNCMTPKP